MDNPVESPSPPTTTARSPQPALIRDSDPPTDPDLWSESTLPEPETWTPTTATADPWGTGGGFTTAVRATRPPWSPNRRNIAILTTVLMVVLALVITIVIVMTRRPAQPDTPAPAPTTSVSPTTTTPVTAAPPPPPPPPPPSEAPPPPEQPNYPRTYYPRTASPERPNVTTPQTRGPDISVRPPHRPAFPGQPGEN